MTENITFFVRSLQWAWPSELPLESLQLSRFWSLSFPQTQTAQTSAEVSSTRVCSVSGSERRRFVRRWQEQQQKQALPLSLLFSFDKESSFCLSDFLCLWPSIEDKGHLSIKTQFIVSYAPGPPRHMGSRSPFTMRLLNVVDFYHNKQLYFSDLCIIHLGMVMWQPMSRSRSILLKATSCRRHRSSSERLCRGTGLRPMLRPDTLFQVKSLWGHADADTQHSSLSPRCRFTANHTLPPVSWNSSMNHLMFHVERWQLTLGNIRRMHCLCNATYSIIQSLGLNYWVSGNCVLKEQKNTFQKI